MQASLLLTAFVGLAFALARPAMAQTLGCVGGGTGGAVPTAGTGGGGTFPTELPPYPGVYTLNVPALPPGASVVSEVKVLGITHTAAADLHFVLTSPAGVAHNLLFRHGGSCDFAGDYTLVPGCSGAVVSPWTCSGLLFPGAYEQFFGLWPEGESGLVNASIATIPAATGVWTLSVYDWDSGDIGNVNSWELCFGAPPTTASHAPSGAPTPTLPHDGAVRFGPSIQFGWLPDPCATSYDLEIDGVVVGNAPSASCIHSTSAGVHTWRVRSRNAAGAGPWSVALSFTDLGAPPAPCSGAQLATMLDRDFSSGSGSILFFDVDVLRPSGILVSELDTNTTAAVTAQITLQVYLKPERTSARRTARARGPWSRPAPACPRASTRPRASTSPTSRSRRGCTRWASGSSAGVTGIPWETA